MEGTLTRWIRHICNSYTSFTVTLDNFSGFVPHTIFLQIENVQPFKQLAANLKALDHFIRANDCPPLKLVTTPHLPIARRLPEQVYFRALQEYMQRPFRQSFAVNNLVLVKRTGEHAACQAVQVFALPEPGTCFN
jgi:2'-5' RNA ligase